MVPAQSRSGGRSGYLTVGMVCAHHLGGDLVTVPFAGSRSVDVGLGPSSLSGILAPYCSPPRTHNGSRPSPTVPFAP
ncbi:hypothetical protein JCM18918_919 [Cutibacterium acnes JCM 18918]|nr:hypothetical protein JCM18918_919 [Cutibacterium acnes JCM 18918]